MKLIIDIPEEDYKFIKDLKFYNSGRRSGRTIERNVINGIKNGKPLPKGHGRLIDADELKTSRIMALVVEKNAPQNEISFAPLVCILKENIDNAMTIVEADKEAEK